MAQWGGDAESRKLSCLLNANISCLKILPTLNQSLISQTVVFLQQVCANSGSYSQVGSIQTEVPTPSALRQTRAEQGKASEDAGFWKQQQEDDGNILYQVFFPSHLQMGCATTSFVA